MKIFRAFRVFEYALRQKTKTQNAGNQQKAFQIKKTLVVNGYHYWKTAIKLPNCYLSTILALIRRKASFKVQW